MTKKTSDKGLIDYNISVMRGFIYLMISVIVGILASTFLTKISTNSDSSRVGVVVLEVLLAWVFANITMNKILSLHKDIPKNELHGPSFLTGIIASVVKLLLYII